MKKQLQYTLYSLLLLLYFCIEISAQSPSWQWAKRTGSSGDNINTISGNESINDIKVDKNGNVYAVGNFFANPAFHNAQLFGQTTPIPFAKDDAYLIKYNSCGQLLWWRRMGGANNDGATSLVLDGQGKVIVNGYCTSNPSYYSGGANSATISGAQANGPQFIAKFDTAGTFLSVNTYPFGHGRIFLMSQGNYLTTDGLTAVVISTLGAVTSTMAFITPTPFYPLVQGISLDKFDNIYISGFFNNTISIGSGTVLPPTSSTLIPSSFADNSLVMKFSSAGTCQWYLRGFTSVSDGLTGCVIDTSGNKLIVSGRAWNNSSVFGYLVNGGIGSGGNPIYFMQASNGSLNNAITGSVFNQGGIAPFVSDHDNAIYFAGRTNSLIAFNSNTYTSNGSGVWQSCIGKFDSGNNFLWITMLPQTGTNSNKERLHSITISQQGNVFVGGMFGGTLDSLGTAVNIIGGQQDGFVAKFGFPCGSTLTALSPLAPTSLTGAYQGSLSNLVSWVDNSNFENGFELWYHDASPTFSLLATLPANTTTYNHSGLSYTTTYCYKVRAFNNIGPSVYTNSDCATTPAPASPQAPSNLTALNTGSLINNVAWVDNSFNETSFELWYHDANPTFSLLATLPANTTTYTHTGLSPGTNYCYKAVATNSIGSSAFTNTDCALTPALPNAPTNLVAANTGTLANSVNWVDNSSDETNFELWFHDASPTFSLLVTLPANTTTYTHSGLSHTTTYCYKALATNSVGPSAFTNSDCATTPDTSTVGLKETSFAKNFSLYPNPTKGTVYLEFYGNGETLHLKITDPLGRLVKEEEIITNSGENEVKVVLPSTKGLYFIQLSNYTSTLNTKVLLE